jgi:hypothetical protein
MGVKKTISLKKLIEKESELYWLSFGEMNAIIDSILESSAEDITNKLCETKCVNCYRGIINAELLRKAFQDVPDELPEDWICEINSEQYNKSWVLEKIRDLTKWLGEGEKYIAVEDTTYSCAHSITTDAIENAGRELMTQQKTLKIENVFKGLLFPNRKKEIKTLKCP